MEETTLLSNINIVIELVAAYSVCSKIDLAGPYFNIGVEDSSNKQRTIYSTYNKISSIVMLVGDYNGLDIMMRVMLNIFKYIAYECYGGPIYLFIQ